MDQSSLPTTKTSKLPKATLIIVSNFIILIVGFYIGYSLNSDNNNCPVLGILGGNQKNSYEAGWKAAQEKIEQSGLLRPEPAEIFTVTGTITAVSGSKITLKSNPVIANPLAEQAPEERIITVTANAKIIKQTTKSPDEFAAELEKYRKDAADLAPGETPPAPPSAFVTEEIKLADLKIGDTVSATSDMNIKMSAEFAAKEITISVAPERPAPPTP